MKFKTISFVVCVLLSIASFSFAKPINSVCNTLDDAIDNSIKKIALLSIDGSSDKSAVQQTARSIEVSNQLQLMQINLQIHSQHKCPIRKSAINPYAFKKSALLCYLNLLKDDKEKTERTCNFKNWIEELQ